MADSMITHQQRTEAPRAMAPEQALALVQALHAHLAPELLLETLWDRAAVLLGASGMVYRHGERDVGLDLGEGPHSASYGLDYDGEDLGEITFRFRRKAGVAQLAAVEEVVTLVVPALRNALRHQTVVSALATSHAPAPGADNVSVLASRTRRSTPGSSQDDALVLVRLDGFDDILAEHGDAWAQTLIGTIHQQLREGLRDADSVFQIDEGLLAVLLPRTNEEAALDVAAKIRILIAGLHLKDGGLSKQLTACMGVAGARAASTPEDVLDKARQALVQALAEGTNNIRVA